MASKKSKAASADDNLDELFSGIGSDSKSKKPSKKPTSAAAKAIGNEDILADLESELAPQPASRPHTPRLKETTVARRSTATPPAGEDKTAAARKSTDSSRSLRASFTPSATSSELHESERRGPVEQTQPQQSGGGWWGGILSTATGVMKQAEAAYSQIQQNEEAKKWAEQVKGLGSGIDVNVLKSYGDELRNRALPTLSNIINTIAPPIGSHERLLIHITHDLVGYPSLDPLIYEVFSDVMQQVEGGELQVIQRGHENGPHQSRDTPAGWDDGPWWRQVDQSRELGMVKGLVEGTKLCRVNAESYATEYFAARGGIEAVRTQARSGVGEPGTVRTSDLFLSVQAILTDQDKTLFGRTTAAAREKEEFDDVEEEDQEEFRFAIFVVDPFHEIEYATVSQPIPAKWARWLEAPRPMTPQSGDDVPGSLHNRVHEDIRSIVETGELDPREWVAGWIKDSLVLSAGIVAQWYVARRMQVGANHPRTKAEEEEDDEGGEEEESDDDTE
ncbi:maintenance of telomere capping protein 1 [Trichoderma ceciliae]